MGGWEGDSGRAEEALAVARPEGWRHAKSQQRAGGGSGARAELTLTADAPAAGSPILSACLRRTSIPGESMPPTPDGRGEYDLVLLKRVLGVKSAVLLGPCDCVPSRAAERAAVSSSTRSAGLPLRIAPAPPRVEPGEPGGPMGERPGEGPVFGELEGDMVLDSAHLRKRRDRTGHDSTQSALRGPRVESPRSPECAATCHIVCGSLAGSAGSAPGCVPQQVVAAAAARAPAGGRTAPRHLGEVECAVLSA